MANNHYYRHPSLEDMRKLIEERLATAESLINEDIEKCRITKTQASSFEKLHEVTDPNFYISKEVEPAASLEREILSGYSSEEWINYWQILVNTLDTWLQSGMKGKAVDSLDEENFLTILSEDEKGSAERST